VKPKVPDWFENLKTFLIKKLGLDMASKIFEGEEIPQEWLNNAVVNEVGGSLSGSYHERMEAKKP
jgi:hypothetical protein